MRIKDLNEQVGERPTSAIFRDSKLEPLKISVTPSIARDRSSVSPTDEDSEAVRASKSIMLTFDQSSVVKAKGINDREREDRKRSLSVSSASESVADSDPREKERDKKGRKNSVFGNLFKKRTKKPSKDEEARDLDARETKSPKLEAPTTRAAAGDDKDSLRRDWTRLVSRENNDGHLNEPTHEVANSLGPDNPKEQVELLVVI